MMRIRAISAILAVTACAVPAEAVGVEPKFTVTGDIGMEVRAVIVPKECLKKVGKKKWKQINCDTSLVEPIVLTVGQPLKLVTPTHTFDLIEGIRNYTKAIGAAEYPIEGYSGVCVYLVQKSKKATEKCGPLNGSVDF